MPDLKPSFNEDRKDFMEAVGEMSQRFDIDIFAYVLMTNHDHLLSRKKGQQLIFPEIEVDTYWCSVQQLTAQEVIEL